MTGQKMFDDIFDCSKKKITISDIIYVVMCHECGKSLSSLSQEGFDKLSGKPFTVRLGDNCKSRRKEENKS